MLVPVLSDLWHPAGSRVAQVPAKPRRAPGTLCAPPTGVHFASWLSEAWADVVNAPDPAERSAHDKAGTRVVWAEGLRASDSVRVAVSVTKHGSANYGDKEYQLACAIERRLEAPRERRRTS